MKEYVLQRSPLDKNRLLKLCKAAIEHATEDRSMAKESYKYFKGLVEENSNDNVSKTLMVDSLKLMQSSNKNEAGLIELFIKVEETLSSDTSTGSSVGNKLFDQLESFTNGNK